jgi:hypothetical protein
MAYIFKNAFISSNYELINTILTNRFTYIINYNFKIVKYISIDYLKIY